MEELRPHELQRDFGAEDELVIKDVYDHKNRPWSFDVCRRSPSIYVIFRKDWSIEYCMSGNELRRIYLEHPDEFISEPILLPIPRYLMAALQAKIEYDIDNY